MISNSKVLKHSFKEVFIKPYSLLNKKERKKLRLNIIISFIAGLLEIISVTAFFPLISIIVEPELVQENKFIKSLWDLLGGPSENQFVILLSIGVSFFLIISTFINLISQLVSVIDGSSAQERFAKELYKSIIDSPYVWHLKNNPNIIRNIILNNLTLWNKSVIRVIPLLSGQISGILFAFIALLIATPKLGCVLIIISGSLLTIFLNLIRKKSTKLMNKVREKEETINIFMTETLTGIKDIKLSSRENDFIKIFYKLNHIIIRNFAAASMWNLLPSFLIVLFGQLIILFAASSLFILGIRGGELAAIMAIIVLLFLRLIPLLNRLGTAINGIANSFSWIDSVFETQSSLYERKSNLTKPLNRNYDLHSWRKLNFSGVGFYYPNSKNYVLKNLDFEIKRGLHYAFVGFSGSGKTTTVDLFLGLIEPQRGKILLDGNDIKKVGYKKWQNLISYVPQDPLISYLSLRENIAFGIPSETIDNQKVINCLKQTNLYEIVKSLPQGIYTNLGNQGVSLSGGQKQRVAIARALYRENDILVLDEATSSLDNESEKIIQRTINNLKKEITIISIAHRFSTIKNCDCIYLLNNGEIKEKGNYETLLNQSHLFRRLSNNQKNFY
tara:strand:+ start:950 stop:2794 length:1845 start_codon:yes stop_codon:yes gene_type:complete